MTGSAGARLLRAAAPLLALCVALGSGGVLAQAERDRVLRVAFSVAETGFDPQAAGDIYSQYVNRAIFDSLYRYDYLARPYRIVPAVAAAMPEVSADGKTYTIRVKPGIYFSDDPAFKGRRRELVAQDFVYGIKRILDPKMRSNSIIQVEGRFVGADAAIARATETGAFDYDATIEGLRAIDRYTLRLKLNFPDTELMANLTTTSLCAVAREVIEAYRDASGWVMANPVGTGPYLLKDWRRGQRIVLEASRSFRDERFPAAVDPADRAIVGDLAGRRIPLVPRVEISIIEEGNPRLLAFKQGSLDYMAVPAQLVSNVLDADNRLNAEFVSRGVALQRGIQPAIQYLYFNMEDPVVGGYAPDQVALRRAMGMAYDVDEEIRVIRMGQGAPATQLVPPGMSGNDPTLDTRRAYDVAGAKALLDKVGYRDRDGDGFRERPDGKPLLVKMYSTPAAIDRETDDLWQRNMAAIGIRVEFTKQKWPDLLKSARLGQLQAWRLGNIHTTPEGFNFLALLYGPHAGFANLARFKLDDYDRLYEQARAMPDGPARTRVIRRMTDLFNAYAPWVLTASGIENVIVQPWVRGYKYSSTHQHPWWYVDVDGVARAVAASRRLAR